MQTTSLRCLLFLALAVLPMTGCLPVGYNCYQGQFGGLRARLNQAIKTNASVAFWLPSPAPGSAWLSSQP